MGQLDLNGNEQMVPELQPPRIRGWIWASPRRFMTDLKPRQTGRRRLVRYIMDRFSDRIGADGVLRNLATIDRAPDCKGAADPGRRPRYLQAVDAHQIDYQQRQILSAPFPAGVSIFRLFAAASHPGPMPIGPRDGDRVDDFTDARSLTR